VPQAALGGKSPHEAAGDAGLEIPLAAAVLVLEQTGARSEDRELLQELRDRLQLPRAEAIDPADIDMERISIVRVPRLELAKLTDDQLAKLLDNATMIGSQIAGMAIAEELVSRDSASDGMAAAHRYLIRHDPDLDRACERVDKARQWAASHGESAALWALLDLKLQVERRDARRAEKVLSEIRTNYADEPGVSEAVYQILYAAGWAGPARPKAETDGNLTGAPEPPAERSKLWTPGGDVPAAQQGDKPAIWTP
jgi:hypothetical protein